MEGLYLHNLSNMNFKIWVYETQDSLIEELEKIDSDDKYLVIKETKRLQIHRVLSKQNFYHTSVKMYRQDMRGRTCSAVILYNLTDYSTKFITDLCADLIPLGTKTIFVIDEKKIFELNPDYYKELGIDVMIKSTSLFISDFKQFLKNENNNSNLA